MIGFITLALSVAVVLARDDACTVGQWSDWTQCQAHKCQDGGHSKTPGLRSWSKDAAGFDRGRVTMAKMMREKEALNRYKAQCKAEGSCPALVSRPTEGSLKCQFGYAGDIPCRNIDQMSFLNFQDLGYEDPFPGDYSPRGNDIWGWTDTNGDEYAIMGISGGTSFVRVTDPYNPVTLAFMYTHTTTSTWRDIKVLDHYAYIVSEARDHGMQIVDLHRFRGREDFQIITPDIHYDKVGNSHNLIVNEESKYVYIVGANQITGDYILCDGGLHVVDVRDPLNPRFAGCFGGDGYVHDGQCVNYWGPDTRFHGNEICFCFNEDSFTIVDVTDKDRMTMLSKEDYTFAQYTHQGWATEDFTTLLLDDELDEQRGWGSNGKRTKTYMWDIRDLTKPVVKNMFESTQTAIDHNQYIIKDLTYQANYEAGLRILRIHADPARNLYDLEELAYFDVYPWRTRAEFNGAWSVYPYYPSGNLVVSSIDFGMYVVRPDYEAIENDRKNAAAGHQERTRKVNSKVNKDACPHLEESRPCDAHTTC